jgi:preprotein translocase subunit SecA
MRREELCEEAYQKVMERFKQKVAIMAGNANKVVKAIYESPQGQMYENLMVPVLAGNRQYNIPANLKEAYETESQTVVTAFHKAIMLHIIDDAWKENLRLLDELKHSVHNASYEQKDPLLIFKLESVKLFDNMVNQINDRTVSIIMRAMIPEVEIRQEAPAPELPRRQPELTETHESLTDEAQARAAAQDTRGRQPVQPIRAEKLPGRNDPCPCGSGLKFKNCHGRNL